MKKPTAIQLEVLFDGACQYFVDRARDAELDVLRHRAFEGQPVAHTSLADLTRKQAEGAAAKSVDENRYYAELARVLREECHGYGLAQIISAVEAAETRDE